MRLGRSVILLCLVLGLVLSLNLAGAADRKVVKFLHADTEKPERAQYYEDMAIEFEKANPGIDVQIIGVGFADIQKTYLAAVAAGDAPDILKSGTAEIPMFLDKGVMLDLTPYLTMTWKAQFNPGVLDTIASASPDGKKIYLLPQYVDAIPLNYHKEILAKYGLKVPTDKASYYAVMDALKAKGIENPMQLHGSMSDDFFNILCLQYATRDGVKPVDLSKGTVPFNSKTIVDALKLFKELYDKGYLARNFWSVGGTDGRMGYAQGKHALKMGFFWDVYTHKDMGMPFENQGVAPFPNLVGVKNPFRVAAIFGFFVTKTTKYPKESVKFVRYLTEERAQSLCATNKYFGGALGMPMANRKVAYPSPYTKVYAEELKNGTPFTMFSFAPQMWDTWSANIGGVMEGKKTVEQLVNDLEALRVKIGPH